MEMYNAKKGMFTEALLQSLLRTQNSQVSLPDGKEDFDIFLAKKLYPSLIPGLEALSEQLERIMNDQDGSID